MSPEEQLGELAGDPDRLIEYARQLQEQLSQKEQLLAQQEQLLAEARSYIAELKRQLFGPKADKLTPEQEEQLRQLSAEVQEQAQRPPPLSQEVLEAEASNQEKEKKTPRPRRQVHSGATGGSAGGAGTRR